MSLSELTSRAAVLRATEEYDALGAMAFLARYHFGESRRYLLLHDGRAYASKAIAGVAHGYQFPEVGSLRSQDFNGGLSGAAGKLRALGFDVVDEVSGRRGPLAPTHRDLPALELATRAAPESLQGKPAPQASRVILLGCVKGKLSRPAPAQDLYISDLFRKRRSYAETQPFRWFILSALHGLVRPTQLLEPYDLELKMQPINYRRAWGEKVVDQLEVELGSMSGQIVEVHAGAPYFDALRVPLGRRRAVLSTPLSGLRQGEQLAWYLDRPRPGPSTSRSGAVGAVALALSVLGKANAHSPADFPWGRSDLGSAGLYSWWVDREAANVISSALHCEISAGLIYVGQTGATAWPSGKSSSATLQTRIGDNHLRGRVTASTWRQSLAATLFDTLHLEVEEGTLDHASQQRLTDWMLKHLLLAVHPVDDRDTLGELESGLLRLLDPPMNLQGMAPTSIRAAVARLRGALRQRLESGSLST
jgi:hypothetical protein